MLKTFDYNYCFKKSKHPIKYISKRMKDYDICWEIISEHPNLSESVIIKFADYIDWERISTRNDLSEKLVWDFRGKIIWDSVFMCNYNFSMDFLERIIDYLTPYRWKFVSRCQKLSEKFIIKYKSSINWGEISKYQILSEKFIIKFSKFVDWRAISKYQVLSEKFIEENFGMLDTLLICAHQKLSESFIEKHSEDLNWSMISIHQEISPEFAEKFLKRLNLLPYIKSNVLPNEFLEKYEKKNSWCLVKKAVIAVEKNCGESKRIIIITRNSPKIIHIGCFRGTEKQAIKKIKEVYAYSRNIMFRDAYIDKVKKCFRDSEKRLKELELMEKESKNG